DLLDSLNSEAAGTVKARTDFSVVAAGGQQLRANLIPDVAAASRVSVPQLRADIARRYPALDDFVTHLDEILARFDAGVRFREKHQGDIAELKKAPLRPLPWFLVGAGALVVLSAA